MSSPPPPTNTATPEAEPRPPPSTSQHESFTADDLEFRTITTLLNALECREKITLQNFEVFPKMKPYLKILSALSSLLVRDHEIVAILPKRSGSGVALLVGSDASPFDHQDDFPSPPPSPSQLPGSNLRHYVTRNPRFGDRVGGGIEFAPHFDVTVGLDLDAFLLANWFVRNPHVSISMITDSHDVRKQSFEHHLQSFADLLNAAFKLPGHKTANALKRYSTFRSAPKILRRFTKSAVLHGLKCDIPAQTTPTLSTFTNIERDKLAVALYRDSKGKHLHQQLYSYLTTTAGQSVPPSLHMCHTFFTWLLSELEGEIRALSAVQRHDPPDVFPTALLKSTMLHLEVLQYLSWESDFFSEYVESVRPSRAGQEVIPTDQVDTQNLSNELEEEEETGNDIGTEFETGEDPPTDVNSQRPPALHPWILELRLITSNIHQLKHLLGRLPMREPLSFSFQLIQYGRSGKQLKPWRELVQELFPNCEEANDVLRELEKLGENRNSAFRIFRPSAAVFEFRGEAHCEAVLGCLYTIARSQGVEDSSWVGNRLPSFWSILTFARPTSRAPSCVPLRIRTVCLRHQNAAVRCALPSYRTCNRNTDPRSKP